MNDLISAVFIFITVMFVLNIIIPHFFKMIIKKKFINSLSTSKNIYLTFDDGPHPEATPAIINILKKNNYTATFFINGTKGEKYPELINTIKKDNNLIGNHGYAHLHPWKTGPIRTIIDIRQMEQYLSSLKDTVPLYRPPYGKFNLVSLIYFLIKKQKIIFWNIDAKDYSSINPEQTAYDIIKQIRPGSVILLHDGRDDTEKQSHISTTVAIVELLVKNASENNLKISHILSNQ